MRKNKLFRGRRGMRFTNLPLGQSPVALFVSDAGHTIEPVDASGSMCRSLEQLDSTADRSSGRKAITILSQDLSEDSSVTLNDDGISDGSAFSVVLSRRNVGSIFNGTKVHFSVRPDVGWPEIQVIDHYPSTNDVTVRLNASVDHIPFYLIENAIMRESRLITVSSRNAGYFALGVSSGTFTGSFYGGSDGTGIDLSDTSVDRSTSYGLIRRDSAFLNNALLGTTDFRSRRYSSVVSAPTIDVPSWTHDSIGVNQAFVATAFTSSDHESTTLGYYRSGTQALEYGAVPASASLYYSKRSSYQTLTVRKVASAADLVRPSGFVDGMGGIPYVFSASSGTLITRVSSSAAAVYADDEYPATFFIDVPQKGKIVDLKVWIEIHHNSSSLPIAYDSNIGVEPALISLQSPNLSWGFSRPIWNSQQFKASYANLLVGTVFPALIDTFILWDRFQWYSPSVGGDTTSGGSLFGLRAVFSDGATAKIPSDERWFSWSPTARMNETTAVRPTRDLNNRAYWVDSTGTPPEGWLTGDPNEWATTGANLGPNVIQPSLPILDPIRQTVRTGSDIGEILDVWPYSTWTGDRPGLRGTEMSGTWKLYIVPRNAGDLVFTPIYLRQVRLEFTYETNESSVERIFSPVQPNRAGLSVHRLLPEYIENTAVRYNNTFSRVPTESEIGRTFGIAINSGTLHRSDYALLYRLSGSLADLEGTSPEWLLRNRFGMPSIPMSSASLVQYEAEATVHVSVTDAMRQSQDITVARSLSDVARTINPSKTLVQLAQEFVSGSTT